jgi:transketolase
MFAAHHRLGNLTAIIDRNGQQAMGLTSEVLDVPNLKQCWEAFGWRATEVDGHSLSQLESALAAPAGFGDAPHVIVAKTVLKRLPHRLAAARANTDLPTINVADRLPHVLPRSARCNWDAGG